MQVSMFPGKGNPDTVFMICRHFDPGQPTLVHGDVVEWSQAANVEFGIDVQKTSNPSVAISVGVVNGKNISHGEFGLVQIYGYHDNVKVDGARVVGDILKPSVTTGVCTIIAAATDEAYLRVGVVINSISATRVGAVIRMM